MDEVSAQQVQVQNVRKRIKEREKEHVKSITQK